MYYWISNVLRAVSFEWRCQSKSPKNQCWERFTKAETALETDWPGYSEQSARRWQRPVIARQSVSVSHETNNVRERQPAAQPRAPALALTYTNKYRVCAHWWMRVADNAPGNWVNIRSIVLFYRRPVADPAVGQDFFDALAVDVNFCRFWWRWASSHQMDFHWLSVLAMDFFTLRSHQRHVHELMNPGHTSCRFSIVLMS